MVDTKTAQGARTRMDNSIVGRLVHGLAKYVAVAGGLALIAITVLIVVSVIGRALIPIGLKPITGDYEMVEMATGFAIFAFLPWVHLMRGHAIVTVFTDFFSATINAWLVVAADVLMLAVSAFIAWRHWYGMIDKLNYGETTVLLRMPLWWSYAAGMIGAAAWVVVAAYVLARSVSEAVSGNPSQPTQGVMH